MTLEGKVVLVTRSRERAEDLAVLLRERGARPLVAPVIEIAPVPAGGALDRAIRDAASGAFAWVSFTSAAGVDAWFARASALDIGGRHIDARVAAVGPGTAAALEAHGIEPELVPSPHTTEALGTAFPEGGGKVLLPRADIAPRMLEEALAAKGWGPVRVDAYRSRPAAELPAEVRAALDRGEVDGVTLTSASTVEGFVRLAGGPAGPAYVCIGPVTARAAVDAGLEVAVVAEPHTLEGLVEATERALT